MHCVLSMTYIIHYHRLLFLRGRYRQILPFLPLDIIADQIGILYVKIETTATLFKVFWETIVFVKLAISQCWTLLHIGLCSVLNLINIHKCMKLVTCLQSMCIEMR